MKPVPSIKMSLWQKLQLLKKSNFDFLTSVYSHAGDISQIRAGLQRIIFINHPEYAKQVLQTNLSNYPKDNFYQLAEQIIGQNILTTNDPVFWGEHRKIMAGLFQPQSVLGMSDDIIDVVEEYSRTIEVGKPLCINTMATTLTLKIITRLLFSQSISDEEITKLADLMSYFGDLLIKKRRPFALPIIPKLSRSFCKAHAELKQLIKTIIKSERCDSKPDLLTKLNQHQCPHTGAKLNEEELFSEAALMLFAGHETTANALIWMLITLSKYPIIRSNLQAEIQSVLQDRTLEVSDLERMPLVRAVVMEVLRLFPSFPAVPRYSLGEDVINGYKIPAKSMIVINIAMIHRHPDFWLNPEGFDPQRFINPKTNHKYAFLPFINGPRVCIGNNLALLELQIMTVLLLRKFTFNLMPGQDVSSDYIISLRTQKEVYAQVL